MSTTLDRAREQLREDDPHGLRRACWLARAALESTIDALLAAHGIDADHASERGKLSCLEGAYAEDRHLVQTAEYAWSRLSEACHQHAYQLFPTYTETRHLIELVERLKRVGVSDPPAGLTQ